MNTAQPNDDRADDPSGADNLDLATAQRLRRLSTAPVDMSALESRIRAAIPPPAAASAGRRSRIAIAPRRWMAVAASLAIVVTIGVVALLAWPRPVLASPQVLESIYERGAEMRASMSADQPGMGDMACCVQKVEGNAVTCVTINVVGRPVSMVIGDAKHFKVPDEAGRRTVAGVEYRFQSSAKINMVMAVKDGVWVCLMGEPSVDELISQLAKTPVSLTK
jgi:hypothetical protein